MRALGRIVWLVAAAAVLTPSTAPAGERCESHFPELRAFVERSGSRGTPTEDEARRLIDELDIERALWRDERARHDARLSAGGAEVGRTRLAAISAEIEGRFDQLDRLLRSRAPLDSVVVDPLLACGEIGGDAPIRSAGSPGRNAAPHRPARRTDAPPEGYVDPPSQAYASTTKAEPSDVWPDDPSYPVVAKAAELGHDPIAVYHFVLDEIRSEHYVGSLKSPAAVLRSRSGNDTDQALLLAELLRASGYPARIVVGVVEVPADRLISHYAVRDHQALEELLTAVGRPWSPASGGAAPSAYLVERSWCEVWIAFANFRGLELDGSGETWAVLDPELEDLAAIGDRRVFDEMGFDDTAYLDAYLDGSLCTGDLTQPAACPPPRTLLSAEVDAWLGGVGDPATYSTLSKPPVGTPDELPVLAASMPGHIASVEWFGLEPREDDRHLLHLVARSGGLVLLDATMPLAELVGREAAIWYEPATPDDALIVDSYDGSLWSVPPYLINVTPVIIRRGGDVARGEAGVGMGRTIELEATLIGPGGASAVFVNREIAGAPTVIAAATGPTGYDTLGSAPSSSLELQAEIADTVLERDRGLARELAVLDGLGLGWPQPSLAFVGNEVATDGALGLIQAIDWLGFFVDVDVWGPRVTGVGTTASRRWNRLARLGGSVAEREVFESYGVTAVSADLALAIARSDGIPVLRIDSTNIGSVLPTLGYPASIVAEIEAWVAAGGQATIPEQEVSLRRWTGVGYVLDDPVTGEARYQLAGGLSGGSTADPPDEAAGDFGFEPWPPTRFPVNDDPTAVVAVRKLPGFDGIEGVVGDDAGDDLRVVALDRNGARVAGVPITFSSVTGGGLVVDGNGTASTELSVQTDEHGIAAVGFRFGTDTSANPVYALEHPADTHASRALLHYVDAVGIGFDDTGAPVELPTLEPFWAIAFPGPAVSIRRTDTTATSFVGVVGQWSDTIYIAVDDSFGNPVSNVPVTFQVLPMQLQAACSNELPADQRLNAAVFDNRGPDGQPSCGGHPVLGSCGSETLVLPTSSIGVSAGVIEGNVIAAVYGVTASIAGRPPLSFDYTHPWTIDGTTQACDTPERFRVFSHFLTDSAGRNVNAARVGTMFDWPIEFWIERYEPAPRPGQDPPFYAGGGDWMPACGLDLAVVVDNFGTATQPELNPASWSYSTTVGVGSLPGIHEVRVAGSSFEICTTGQPVSAALDAHVNNVWAVQPEITGFTPPVADLTPDGVLVEPLTIHYRLQPPEYHAYSTLVEVRDLSDVETTLLPASSHSDIGAATLPRGTVVELGHTHVAAVVANRDHPAELRSDDQPLPVSQPIFRDVTKHVVVSQELDVINRTTCAEHDIFSFVLNHRAVVSLTVRRETPTGPGSPETVFSDVVLEAGEHRFTVSPSSATAADITLLPGSYDFDLFGVSLIHGGNETVRGTMLSHFAMRDSLPVGHVMVKGVDLMDGHMVLAREDFSIPTRGVPLSFERTYSSAADSPGPLGPGWSHNWMVRLLETPCDELVLIGTEGSGMRFTPDGAGGWKPPRGHHGTLLLDDVDGTADYYTTGGTRYHFYPIAPPASGPLREWLLDFVEDPSGNRTRLLYEEGGDGKPRVKRVIGPSAREIFFTYEWRVFQYWAGDVLTRVDGPDILSVRFSYDAAGNLTNAVREQGVRSESYHHTFIGFRDVITSVTNDLNGATTRYSYSNEVLGLVGEAADILLVETLTEPMNGVTRFFYDTAALADNGPQLTTWVRSPRDGNSAPPDPLVPGPFDTTYTLNRYGSPTEIRDPLGNTTTIAWETADVVMDYRIDANGVVTDFEHDEHGNLIFERVTVTDVDGVVHDYEIANTYHPPDAFAPPYIKNRIASHSDRNDAVTFSDYDAAGRLERVETTATDANGTTTPVITIHSYDETNGDRLSTTDPRESTTYFTYDRYGYLNGTTTVVTDYLGGESVVSTSSVWDRLGRPVEKTDGRGFTTHYGYDTLGRLTSVTHPEVEIDEDVFARPVATTQYDDTNNTVTEINERGFATINTFDLEGRLVQVRNAAGGVRSIDYDPAGNKEYETTFSDSGTQAVGTRYIYDPADRLTQRIEWDGKLTDFDHDPVGNVVRETLHRHDDPHFLPRVTEHVYDELNRRIRSIRDPPGFAATEELLLDGEGRVLRRTDAEDRTTHYGYDELGRRIRVVGPEWRAGRQRTIHQFYDGNGNPIREVRFNERLQADGSWAAADQIRVTGFDELNRPIETIDAEGHSSYTVYDAAGNIVEEIDRRGNQTSHGYDALNRRVSTTQHLTDPVTGAQWEVVTTRVFDARGNLRHELLPNGNHVVNAYDRLDRLISTSDSIGPIESYDYDARGNRTSITDGNGHTTTFEYDGLDRLTLTSLPEGRNHSRRWDIADNLVWSVNARGGETDYHYDVLDRLVLVEHPEVDGTRYTESATYDLVGNKRTSTDRRGHTTTFQYDDLDRVTLQIDPPLAGPPPAQYSISTTWDAVGNRVGETDRRGIDTVWVFDRENRQIETWRAGIRIRSVTRDEEGNPEYVTDANGNVTHSIFDGRNLETRIVRPEQSVTSFRRDAMGDVRSETDPEGHVTLRDWDLRRRLTSETNAGNETTIFAYDLADNLVSVTRPKGNTWTRTYDDADRLTGVTDPLGNTTRYNYDPQDNLAGITDARGRTTVFEHDMLDRLTQTLAPDGAVRLYGYDGNGNVVTTTDPNDQTTTTIFDELDRATSRHYPAPVHPVAEVLQTISFTWDPNSNLKVAEESYVGGSRTTRYDWDAFDRLEAITDGFGKTISYGYDFNGNRTRLTDPTGSDTRYTYDDLNRVDTVAVPGLGAVADFDWFRNGLVRRTTYPNGTTAEYGYDAANRLSSIVHRAPVGAVISSFSYAYDRNGNRTEQREQNGAADELTTYLYDPNDRLYNIAYPDRTTTYGLDQNGNRITEKSLDPTGASLVDRILAYDDRNRLTHVEDRLDPGRSITYAYDPNGNQTRRSQDGVELEFRYDARDQLLEVDHNGSLAWTFSFDSRGLRVSKWGAAGLINYTYDDSSVLQQHSAVGDTVATFHYGPDRLLATNHFSQGLAFYHHDALGSITNLTDPAGAVLNRYSYDAWGNHRTQSGDHWNPFRFTGHEYDPETNLYYAKARFYDPEVARFLTEDPAEPDLTTPPSLHRYLYAYGNPTVWIDPMGRNVVDPRFKVDDRFPHYEFEDQIYAVNPLNGEVYRQHATRYSALDPNDPEQAETIAVINSMSGIPLPDNYWRLQTMYELAGHQLTEAEEREVQREIASAVVSVTPGLETAQEFTILTTGYDPAAERYVDPVEYVLNIPSIAAVGLNLKVLKQLAKRGSIRLARSKNASFIVDESGGLRAVLRNIDTDTDFFIVPRRGTGASPGDTPRPPRAAAGAREPPPALPAGEKVKLLPANAGPSGGKPDRSFSLGLDSSAINPSLQARRDAYVAWKTRKGLQSGRPSLADFDFFRTGNAGRNGLGLYTRKSGMGDRGLERARRLGVERAWVEELALIRRGGATREWTALEQLELEMTGRIRGYYGHHINSAARHPHLASNPSNVEFVTWEEHIRLHGGNWANPTTGPLIPR